MNILNLRFRDGLLSFEEDATWFSEAMLPTKFTARKRGDMKAESRTNVDGVIGHIEVGVEGKADFHLVENATQLIVVEAKLNSKLTEYVSNVSDYDQAARTVAYMAETLKRKNIHPDKMLSLAYYVLAPEKRIVNSNFKELVDECSIRNKVRKRVDDYGDAGDYKEWFTECFEPTLNEIDLDVISWESAIEQLPESKSKERVKQFYQLFLDYN
jgi:hypothetical protein